MASSSRHFHFTKQAILDQPLPPVGKKIWFRDKGRKGLSIEITAGGNRTFWFQKTFMGKRQDRALGRFPELSVKEARKEVDVLLGELAKEGRITSTVPSLRGSKSLDDYFKYWLENHGKPHRPGTWRHDENLYDNHIKPAMGHLKLPTIGIEQVQALHVKMGKGTGQRSANRMLQLVSIMFNCAKQWKLYVGDNPIEGIKRFPEKRIERYLAPEEVPRLFNALKDKKTPPAARDFVFLAMFTGQRKSNVLGMKWTDIDLENRLWLITPDDSKTDKAIAVPLPEPAIVILKNRLKESKPNTNWVFPARTGEGHMGSNFKVWKDILKRASISNLRIHDLRHSLASWQAMAGSSLHIIGKSLGHSSQSTTARYAHLDLGPVRASLDSAATAMIEASKNGSK